MKESQHRSIQNGTKEIFSNLAFLDRAHPLTTWNPIQWREGYGPLSNRGKYLTEAVRLSSPLGRLEEAQEMSMETNYL